MSPQSRYAQIAALTAAIPDYTFNLIMTGDKTRYEAVAKDSNRELYCLISADAGEIWCELRASTR